MKEDYQNMVKEAKALKESLERSYMMNPLHGNSHMKSYRALGAKVRNASISIRRKISLDERNLTNKGKFLKFIIEMEKCSIQDGWINVWQWYTVKDYYEEEMKKRDQRFLSDVTKPRRKENQFKYIQRVSNIKKMISDFSFAEFMKMTYFMLNNPEDAYSFGYFNREFKLSKMVQKDRLDGIYGIMNKASYWNDKEIFIKTIEELTESKEYKEELRMQAIARLSDEEVQELNTLKKEFKTGEEDILTLYQASNEKLEEYHFIYGYLKRFQNHLRDSKSKRKAMQYTLEDYQGHTGLPDLDDAPNIIKILKEDIDQLDEKLDLMENASKLKERRIKELETISHSSLSE